MLEVASKMKGADGRGRVMVLDVDFSSTHYGLHLGNRASRHAYYLRPPEGKTAQELKEILDEAGGEAEFEFRYYAYPEIETDLKPLLTADPFAGKYFDRNSDQKYLQLEGERPHARETIAQLIDDLKEPFSPESFPRLHEFVLRSFTSGHPGNRGELVLLRDDGERDELRKAEPEFHVALAEHGVAKEIGIYRPTVNETDPVLILSTNEHSGAKAQKFLADMARYFESPEYRVKLEAARLNREAVKRKPAESSPSHHHHSMRAQAVEPARLTEKELVSRISNAVQELAPTMKGLQKREILLSGPYVTIQFPGKFGFGKGPTDKDIKELASIFTALEGDPSFGSEWFVHYQVDKATGQMRIAPTYEAKVPAGWTNLPMPKVFR